MMGRHHALLAEAGALAVARAAGAHPAVALAAGGTAAGAGLLPDLDEPGSSVAHMAEPVSGGVAWLTARVCGGHRQASHSALAAALVTGVTAALGHVALAPGVPASVVVVGIAFAIAARALLPFGLRPGHAAALVVGAGGAWAAARFVGLGFAWWAVGLGVLLHLVGDAVTAGGVPLLWPWRRRVAWPVLDHTGSLRERFAAALLAVTVVALAAGPVVTLVAAARKGGAW
jgi:membrane-bound metal-dependent hydrolase YbcI (DUF457 family)